MKKLMFALPLLLAGCQLGEEIKDGVVNAPVDFFTTLREVLLYVFDILVNAVGGWLTGLLG